MDKLIQKIRIYFIPLILAGFSLGILVNIVFAEPLFWSMIICSFGLLALFIILNLVFYSPKLRKKKGNN